MHIFHTASVQLFFLTFLHLGSSCNKPLESILSSKMNFLNPQLPPLHHHVHHDVHHVRRIKSIINVLDQAVLSRTEVGTTLLQTKPLI